MAVATFGGGERERERGRKEKEESIEPRPPPLARLDTVEEAEGGGEKYRKGGWVRDQSNRKFTVQGVWGTPKADDST